MPNWKKVVREIARSVDKAAHEVEARRQARQADRVAPRPARPPLRVVPRRATTPQKTCLFWSCNIPIREDHIVCREHYADLADGLLDECPGCNQAKYAEYDLCLRCVGKPQSRPARSTLSGTSTRSQNQWYKPEYSPAWDARDATADQFFVYILKMDGGRFYAGHTRELRERLSEHRDGSVQSTKGQNPKLVWFATLPSREEAATMEVSLKKLVDTNPREVRRMVIRFRDLVRELDYR